MPSILGQKIYELRRARALTLEQLAEATGSSKSYMWEIENKDVARPSAEKLVRVAEVLRVPLEYLTDDERLTPTADELDEAFYRRFQRMRPDTKETLRRILDALDEE